MTMRRSRGFSLAEILVALGLSGLVAAGMLALTRGQLQAIQLSDSTNKLQQNVRAGMDFVENLSRRACGGVASGQVGLDVPPLPSVASVPCLRVWESAMPAGGSFAAGTSGSASDALEVIYATGTLTATTAAFDTQPSVTVASTTLAPPSFVSSAAGSDALVST